MITQLRQFVKDAARDPQSVEVIVGADLSILPDSLGLDRPLFAGSEEQVMNDIQALKKLGADEIFFIIFSEGEIKDLLAAMERSRRFA